MVRAVCQVEKDSFCQNIIRQRIQDGCAHEGEVHADICEYTPDGDDEYDGVLAGFPCHVENSEVKPVPPVKLIFFSMTY